MARIHFSKKASKIPKKLPKRGPVRIRPISFHMDRTIDKYVVTGGGFKPSVVGTKYMALTIAKARVRIIEKRKERARFLKRKRRKH